MSLKLFSERPLLFSWVNNVYPKVDGNVEIGDVNMSESKAMFSLSRDILFVEDHKDIAELVYEHLETVGYRVDYADNGTLGKQLATENSYDAVVLDLMLPDIDGLEVCQYLRTELMFAGPIIMLTARDTLSDKLTGFESGADDYLVKPFDLEELSARLNSLMRRFSPITNLEVLSVGDLTIDLSTHRATREGQPLALSPIGLKILTLLMSTSPKVVARRQVEKLIWEDLPPDSDALRSHLYNLRKIVDKPFSHSLIHTVHGVGFRLSHEA
jgi:DNA-binding response OmpR family regulator